MKNSKALMIAGLSVAAVVLLIFVFLIGHTIGKRDNKNKGVNIKESQSQTLSADSNGDSQKESQQAGEEKTTQNEEPSTEKEKKKLEMTYTISSEWENGSEFFQQYDFVVKNVSGATIKDWQIVYDVPEGSKVQSAWNCNCKIEGTKLYVDAKDFFAAQIENDKTCKDMGAIIKSTTKKPVSEKYDVVLDGKVDNNEPTSEQPTKQEETQKETQQESQKESQKETQTETKVPVVVGPSTGTEVQKHGQLSVSGTQMVDQYGNPYRLCGVSTHGLQWFPQYVTKESFQYLRDDWGANVVRLAMYIEEGGYLQGSDKNKMEQLIDDGVKYATELGMYVIIDWHILNGNSREPLNYKNEAIEFFTKMAKKYDGHNNVIYEICNEPNGTSWAGNIKPYADAVVAEIRKYDKDAIILVGTNTWSQDVDDVIGNRVANDKNVMYVAHFYAATHKEWIRNKVQKALSAGIPIFVSECSICDASGNGNIDYNEAKLWFDFLDKNNIGYVCWNLCNKNESSALIGSHVSGSKVSGFSVDELSETGKWFRARIRKNLLE